MPPGHTTGTRPTRHGPCSDGPTDQAHSVNWALCLRGGCSQGHMTVRLSRRGPGAKRNFPPGEDINEPPATVGEERNQRSSSRSRSGSRFMGVSWFESCSAWIVQLWDTQQEAHRDVRLRGGRSQGVRLCSCRGARTKHQAQLPRRRHQRAASEGEADGEAEGVRKGGGARKERKRGRKS
jgi:hypothetical protein